MAFAPVDGGRVNVSWAPADGNGAAVTAYEVNGVTTTNQTWALLDGLADATTHEVTVAGRSYRGEGVVQLGLAGDW